MMNISIDELQKIHAEALQNGNTALVQEIEGMGAFEPTTSPQNALSPTVPAVVPTSPSPTSAPSQNPVQNESKIGENFFPQLQQYDLNKDGFISGEERKAAEDSFGDDGINPLSIGIPAALLTYAATPTTVGEQNARKIVDTQLRVGNNQPLIPKSMIDLGSRPNTPTGKQSALLAELNERVPEQESALKRAQSRVSQITKEISTGESEIAKNQAEINKRNNRIDAISNRPNVSLVGSKKKDINAQQQIKVLKDEIQQLKSSNDEISKRQVQLRRISDAINARIDGTSAKFSLQSDLDKSNRELGLLKEGIQNPTGPNALVGTNAKANNPNDPTSVAKAKVESDKGLTETAGKQAHLKKVATDFNMLEPGSNSPLKSIVKDGLIDQDKLINKLSESQFSLLKRYQHFLGSMTKEKMKKMAQSPKLLASLAGGLTGGYQYLSASPSEERMEFLNALQEAQRIQQAINTLK